MKAGIELARWHQFCRGFQSFNRNFQVPERQKKNNPLPTTVMMTPYQAALRGDSFEFDCLWTHPQATPGPQAGSIANYEGKLQLERRRINLDIEGKDVIPTGRTMVLVDGRFDWTNRSTQRRSVELVRGTYEPVGRRLYLRGIAASIARFEFDLVLAEDGNLLRGSTRPAPRGSRSNIEWDSRLWATACPPEIRRLSGSVV